MPIIGKFKESVDPETGVITYKGGISYAGVDQAFMLVPNTDRRSDRSPALRLLEVPTSKYGEPECGAGFDNTRRSDGQKFIGLSVQHSRFPHDLDLSVWPGREPGTHVVVWNRPKERQDAASEGAR